MFRVKNLLNFAVFPCLLSVYISFGAQGAENGTGGSLRVLMPRNPVRNANAALGLIQNISSSSYRILQANETIKNVTGGLEIIGPEGNLISFLDFAGEGAKIIYLAPLIDGGFLIQALAERDLKEIGFRAAKLGLFVTSPICYSVVTGFETIYTVWKLYSRAWELKESLEEYLKFLWDPNYRETHAKESACTIL